MGNRISGFRTPEAAAEYRHLYEDMVARRWPILSEELDVATRFGKTRVRRSGPAAGTPLLLLHPTTGSSLGWQPVIERLSRDRNVYTPDTIGTAGMSVQERPVTSPEDLSDWLDNVLERLELDRVHLAGYSEGGWIAALHAATTQRRDRLATLSLIEPAGAIEQIPRRTLIALVGRAMATLVARDKPRALRKFNRWMNGDIELDDDQIELVLFVFRNHRQRLPSPKRLPDGAMAKLTLPTHLVLAENTIIYDPAAVAERARRLMPDVQIDLIPDAGHGVLMQYPELVTSRLLEFIDAHA